MDSGWAIGKVEPNTNVYDEQDNDGSAIWRLGSHSLSFSRQIIRASFHVFYEALRGGACTLCPWPMQCK